MSKTTGLLLGGSLKKSGVTFYEKGGQMIVRSAHSEQTRSNTRGQFVQRQRMRHTTALWQALKPLKPMFSGGKSTYGRFATLANRLPAVFVPKIGPMSGASFLMADMPVSDGNLPQMKLSLGVVNGTAALITDLKASELHRREVLMLYTAEQRVERRTPQVHFLKMRDVSRSEFVEVDGCLALVDEAFADDMKGWALVRVYGDRCSTQTLVTRCSLYEQYTTEEALQEAAKSYGGLTK